MGKSKKSKKGKKGKKTGKDYVIEVKVDGNRLSLSVRKQTIRRKHVDTVAWTCKNGKMKITWPGPNGNPFPATPFEGPAIADIGPVSTDAAKDKYNYTLTIYPDDDPTVPVEIDPQIEVDDSRVSLRVPKFR